MLKRLRDFFFTVTYPYTNLADQQLALYVTRFVVLLGITITLMLIVPLLLGTVAFNVPILLSILIVPTAFVGVTRLINRGYLNWALNLLIILFALMAFSGAVLPAPTLAAVMVFFVPLVAAGVLGGRRVIVSMAIVTFLVFAYVLSNSLTVTFTINAANRLANLSYVAVSVVFTAILLAYFGEARVRLSKLLGMEISELRRALNSPELTDFSLDETSLIKRVLQRVRDEFGFTFAQFALVDGSGNGADKLYMALGFPELQRGEHFELSVATPLAEAIRTTQAVQVDEDSTDIRRRHLAAGMISALIIPIIHNDKVLGALDLQSNQIKDFTPTQREALAVYGQRVGQTLDRIRIMAQLKADVQTQQKIINGQRKKLQELEQSSRAGFAADTWRTYFDQYGGGTLGFDLSSDTFDLVNAADLTPTLRQALTTDGLVESKDGDQNVLSAPILLRGELLGALSFKLPRGAQANDRQREVITSVVQRLGLALENKRLLQQSQAQANRESKANEVAGVLLSSTDVKTVLQLAAQQFTDALGAVNTHIHLQALELGEKR